MSAVATIPDNWLSLTEAAQRAKIRPRTIRRWLNDGLRAFKPGKRVLVRAADLDEYIAAHPRQGGAHHGQ